MRPSGNRPPIRHHAVFLKTRARAIATLLALTCLLVYFGRAIDNHAKIDHLTERALSMTSAIDGAGTIIFPLHRAENCSYRGITLKPWQVACQGERLFCDYSFDEKTNRCVRMIGSISGNSALTTVPGSVAPISPITASDAVRIGLNTLKTLEMFPKGCLIALDTDPRYTAGRKQWHMSWGVKVANQPIYHIHVNLDYATGLPIWVSDTRY